MFRVSDFVLRALVAANDRFRVMAVACGLITRSVMATIWASAGTAAPLACWRPVLKAGRSFRSIRGPRIVAREGRRCARAGRTMAQGQRHRDWQLYRKWALLLAAVLPAVGCAAGAWLERSLTEDLPIDPPKNGYPTAVRASLDDDSAPAPPAVATEAPEPARQRQNPNQPLLTPLAVVPSQLVRSHPNAAPAVPASAPVVATAEAPPISARLESPTLNTTPQALNPWSASAWSPPELAITSLPAPRIDPSAETSSPQKVEQVAHADSDSSEDGTARLEKARSELIKALETQIRERRETNASDEELPRLEQQLRLAYLEAGRLDDAVSAIDSLDQQQREAWKNLMFGVGVWLSPDEARRAPLRSAKVLRSLRDATNDLAAASKLEVRNLVFCERVDHFGWYSEFPRKEFQPKQQVILYAEIENFAAEHKGGAGYETELQGSYEILDSSGQIVASRQLQLDKEVCRNYRRDYFLAYRIYMPDHIAPGHYRLELTVEDLKAKGKYQGRKLGDGVIELTIR